MNIDFHKNTEVNSTNFIPEKKRNWDRWLYLFVVVLLLGSLLKWWLSPYFIAEADGVLLQKQYDVKFPFDIQILSYQIKDQQEVAKGDTLFTYERYDESGDISFTEDSINLIIEQNKGNSNLIALDAQIEKRRLLIKELNARLEFWKKERIRKENLVYLDVITPNELANVDRSIDDVAYNLATIETEYKVLLEEKRQLQAKILTDNSLGSDKLVSKHITNVFISPVDGKVDRLRFFSQEICYKKEIITSIVHPEEIVKAYIDVKDLTDFYVGTAVEVVLPYRINNKLHGRVSKMYSVSELKDNELLNNTLEENKYGIVVEIVPEKNNETNWKSVNLSNIPVKIKKKRAWFNFF